MLALSLVSWWYSRGWANTLNNLASMLVGISRLFSVPILLRTLFSPWKRIISYPGASLEAKFRAFTDNLVSRAVGFVVRVLVLCTALIMEALAACVGVLWVALWPLLPVATVALLVKAVIG